MSLLVCEGDPNLVMEIVHFNFSLIWTGTANDSDWKSNPGSFLNHKNSAFAISNIALWFYITRSLTAGERTDGLVLLCTFYNSTKDKKVNKTVNTELSNKIV